MFFQRQLPRCVLEIGSGYPPTQVTPWDLGDFKSYRRAGYEVSQVCLNCKHFGIL